MINQGNKLLLLLLKSPCFITFDYICYQVWFSCEQLYDVRPHICSFLRSFLSEMIHKFLSRFNSSETFFSLNFDRIHHDDDHSNTAASAISHNFIECLSFSFNSFSQSQPEYFSPSNYSRFWKSCLSLEKTCARDT